MSALLLTAIDWTDAHQRTVLAVGAATVLAMIAAFSHLLGDAL